jgi:hypothetical protein
MSLLFADLVGGNSVPYIQDTKQFDEPRPIRSGTSSFSFLCLFIMFYLFFKI